MCSQSFFLKHCKLQLQISRIWKPIVTATKVGDRSAQNQRNNCRLQLQIQLPTIRDYGYPCKSHFLSLSMYICHRTYDFFGSFITCFCSVISGFYLLPANKIWEKGRNEFWVFVVLLSDTTKQWTLLFDYYFGLFSFSFANWRESCGNSIFLHWNLDLFDFCLIWCLVECVILSIQKEKWNYHFIL